MPRLASSERPLPTNTSRTTDVSSHVVQGPGMAMSVNLSISNSTVYEPKPSMCQSWTNTLLVLLHRVSSYRNGFSSSTTSGSAKRMRRQPAGPYGLGGLLMVPIPGSYGCDIVRWHVDVLPQRRTANLLHKLDACK